MAEVVDSYEKRFATACTRRILEAVALRSAVAEYLVSLRRGRGSGTTLVVLMLLLLLERSLSVVRRQRRSLIVLLLGRRVLLLAIRRRRRGAILLAIGLLLVLLGRRRALVVAVLGLLLIPSTVSSAMRIVVSLAWVCHFERCSRPSAVRKCSEQKSTVESDATVQCLGGSVYACLIASRVVSDVAVVVSALSSCVCERG